MKIDMHIHTSQVSQCAHVDAAEMVQKYIKSNYNAIIITDHFTPEMVQRAHEVEMSSKDFYLMGYRAAKEAARDSSLQVFLGAEIRFKWSSNDYLVYGMDENFFAREEVVNMRTREFSKLCSSEGLLFYQAHPFRNNMTMVDPSVLFGIEISNMNPRHDSRNDIAAAWAGKFSLSGIGGSDFHDDGDEARGGIICERYITNEADLISILRSGEFSVI